MRSHLMSVFCLLAFFVSGCATQVIRSSSEVTDALKEFRSGTVRLDGGLSSAGRYGASRRTLLSLYQQGLWNDLAIRVIEVGHHSDQGYFYLGKAAEETGFHEAARTYYNWALAVSKTTKRCNFVFDNCDDLDVPGLSSMGLDRLKSTDPAMASSGEANLGGGSPQSRIEEAVISHFYLSISSSRPEADGSFILSITTGVPLRSLRVNGDEVGIRADGRYSLRRFAQLGDNQLDVLAVDRSGNVERQTVTVSRNIQEANVQVRLLDPSRIPESDPKDAIAIIIGIENYRKVPAADFAGRDASVFYDYARRALGIKPENIRLLVDEKADSAEIILALRNWLPTRVNKGNTDVYFFYSGHGLPSPDGNSLYFLPHEANRDLLDRTAISQSELVEALQRANPKSVTMFIDSCYSGQSRTGETLLASARPIAVLAKQATSFPQNFTVISASAPDQISSSSPDLKHGIFSYYLMRGMEGDADANKDKQITVGEMQAYLAEKVSRRALGINRTQHPQVAGDLSRVLLGK